MTFHGNSNKNNRLHHLYGIYDKEDDGLFKYGQNPRGNLD